MRSSAHSIYKQFTEALDELVAQVSRVVKAGSARYMYFMLRPALLLVFSVVGARWRPARVR